MSGNRELTIRINVSAGHSKQVVDALAAALGRLGIANTKAANAQKGAMGSTAQSAKQAASGVDALEARLKQLAKTSPEAKRALTDLRNSYRQFGQNSKEAASALTAATNTIKTFQATASKVGKGNTSLLGSSIVKTRNELAAMGQELKKVADEAKRSIGSGNLVAPLRQMLDSQIATTRRALDDLKRSQSQLQSLMKDKAAGVQGISNKDIKNAEAEVKRLTAAFATEKSTLESLGVTLSQTASQTRSVAAATQQAATFSKAGAAAAKAYAQAQAQVATSVTQARVAIQQQIDTNRRNAYSFTIMGYQAKFAGDQMKESFKGAANTFAEFDFTARRAAVTLGLLEQGSSATAVGLGDFEKEFQQVAITTKLFSPEEVAKGFYFWGSTTGQVVDSMGALKDVSSQVVPIMKAAAMTGTDLESALKGVYAITEQFNLGVDESSNVMDRLFYVTQKTALELPDLLNSFKMVGPIAAQANVSFEDMTTLLGAIGDAGIKGTMAGRAFRQFFIRLAKDSALTTEMLDEQVVALGGVQKTWDELVFPEGKFIGMQETLNQFSRITAKLTQHQKEQVLASASTAGEYPVLTELVDANTRALTDNTGKLDLNRMGIIDVYNEQKNLADSVGSVESQWKVMGNSAKAIFGELANRIAPVVLRVGQSLVEAFTPVAKVIGDVAEAIARWADANPAMFDLIVRVAAIGAGLLSLAGTVLLVSGAIKLLTGTVLKEFAVAMIGNDAIIAATTGRLGLYGAALSATKARVLGLTTAVKAQSAALILSRGGIGSILPMIGNLAGGLRMVVGAGIRLVPIAALVIAVVGAFDGLSKAVGGAGISMKGVGKVVGDIAKFFGELLKLVVNLGTGIFKLAQGIGFLAGKFLGLINSIPGVKLLGDVFSNLTGFVGDLIGGLGDAVAGLNKFFGEVWANVDKAMGYKPDYSALGEGQDADKAAAVQAAADVRQAKYEIAQQAIQDAAEAGRAEAEAYAKSVQEHAEVVRQATENGIYLPTQITFTKTAKMAEESGKLVAQSFNGGIFTSEADVFAGGQFIVDSAMRGVKSSDKEVAEASRESLLNFVNTWYTEGAQNVPPMASAIVGFIEGAVASEDKRTRQIGLTMAEYMATGFRDGGVSETPVALSQIMSTIHGYINSTNPQLRDRGMEMMQWLANGLLSDPNVSANARTVLMGVLQTMQSGNPAAAQSGYALMASWVQGQYQGINLVKPLAAQIAAVTAALYGDERFVEGSGSHKALQAKLAALKSLQSLIGGGVPNIGAFTGSSFKPPPLPKSSGGGGGGGGSGSSKIGGSTKQSNPLEDALKVAQNAAELAAALKKIEGLDVKAMVKSSMGHIAEAMKLAVTITAKVAATVSTKTLQQVSDFSNAAKTVAEAMGSMSDSFAAAAKFKYTPNETLKGILYQVADLIKFTFATAKAIPGSRLGITSTFASAASDIAGAFGSIADAFGKLGGYKAIPVKVLRALAADMATAVNIFMSVSKSMKSSLVEAAASIAGSAADIVASMAGAFESFDKLRSTSLRKSSLLLILSRIASDMRMAVQVMMSVSRDMKQELVAASAEFADSAASVAANMAEAFVSFGKLGDSYGPIRTGNRVVSRKFAVFEAIAKDMVLAVQAMIQASSTMNNDLVKATADFSDGAGRIIAVIADAFAAFSNLNSYTKPLPGVLKGIVETTIVAVRLMIGAMKKFSLSTEQTEALRLFSDTVGSVVGAIGGTYDAFVKTIQFVDQFREVIDFNTVFGWIATAMTRMSALSKQYTPEVIEKTKALAEAVTAVAGSIEAFFGLGLNASQDPTALASMIQQALAAIVVNMSTFVTAFTGIGADIMQNLADGMRSQETYLEAEVARVQNILGNVTVGDRNVTVDGREPTMTIRHVISDPDGALKSADSTEVARLLSGDTFISNLAHSAQTQ